MDHKQGTHGGHHGGHHGHRKKRSSLLRLLRNQAKMTFMPNTYGRRMTRYSAYDFDSVTVRAKKVKQDEEKVQLQEMEDRENLFLESLLTKIHNITSMFVLVNIAHSSFPIVYVSDEFLNFWHYSKKEIFLHDGRLPMMVGPSTDPNFRVTIEEAMTVKGEHSAEYTLYKKGHKKTVDTYVSVLALPVHSKAKYVLVSTEEEASDNFGVETDTAEKSNKKTWLPFNRTKATDSVGEEVFVSNLMAYRNVITQQFEQKKEHNILILHDSLLKVIWDWLILYVVIWTTFIVPLQLAFHDPVFKQQNHVSLLCDILFMFEVLFSCLTTFINDDGIVISELKSIWKNYWTSGWFFVDFAGAIPWELIFFVTGVDKMGTVHATWVNDLMIISLLRVSKVLRRMEFYTHSGFACMVVMMTVFAVFGHWFACGWYKIGDLGIAVHDGWMYNFANNEWSPYEPYEATKGHHEGGVEGSSAYAICLYFTITSLTTTGFGNMAPSTASEKMYSVVVMVAGSMMYAFIFGNVANIIQRINQQESELVRRESELVDFMHVNKFPESLRNRMEDYFYNYWYTTRGVDAHEIMENWPKALREDAYHYIHDLLFTRWPAFDCASIGFQRTLSGKLQRIVLCPGDTIYHSGDCVGELYFVIRGHIKVIKDNRLNGILTSGDIFGEEFWPTRTSRKSKATVQALTYCEFEVLSHESLNEILIQYPDYWDIWRTKLKITYELSMKGDMFAKIPDELVDYVKSERTASTNIMTDEMVELIQNNGVLDPKKYFQDLKAKLDQQEKEFHPPKDQ